MTHRGSPPCVKLIISSSTPASLRTRMMNRRGGACWSLGRKLVRMRGPGSIDGMGNIARRMRTSPWRFDSTRRMRCLENVTHRRQRLFSGRISIGSARSHRCLPVSPGRLPRQASPFSAARRPDHLTGTFPLSYTPQSDLPSGVLRGAPQVP